MHKNWKKIGMELFYITNTHKREKYIVHPLVQLQSFIFKKIENLKCEFKIGLYQHLESNNM
jgi:hypothetical protein